MKKVFLCTKFHHWSKCDQVNYLDIIYWWFLGNDRENHKSKTALVAGLRLIFNCFIFFRLYFWYLENQRNQSFSGVPVLNWVERLFSVTNDRTVCKISWFVIAKPSLLNFHFFIRSCSISGVSLVFRNSFIIPLEFKTDWLIR